jgi:peptidoglycan/LPS O-acetylase OafA/YrhL
MYHPIAIVISLNLLLFLNQVADLWLYPLSVGITILIAGLSYRYYESFFLKFKSRFTRVASGEGN